MSASFREDWNNCLFAEPKGKVSFERGGFKRIEIRLHDSCSMRVDSHLNSRARFHFVQFDAGDGPENLTLSDLGEIYHCLYTNEMGTLARVRNEDQELTVWFPANGGKFKFDKHRRISKCKDQNCSYRWEFYPRVRLTLERPKTLGDHTVVPYVVVDDPTGRLFAELACLNSAERCVYLKSEWFSAAGPSDIWKYLINGSIYDPRPGRGIGKRFRCQQCAFSWWTYFDFLHLETDKTFYVLMQDEVAFSVLMDMSSKGHWEHGCWSDDMETHARFHLDGIHLLMSQYEKTHQSMWLEAAERGVAFLSTDLTEQLDDGSLWFLHDTIEERSTIGHYFSSSLFGKSPGNTVCINTHVMALTVIYRLRQAFPNGNKYEEMFEKGVRALRRVLEYESGGVFYRILIPWIVKNIIRTDYHSNSSRFFRALEQRIIKWLYWRIRRRFPRLVQPGGFTERDLSLTFFSHSYHILNLKDFLTLYEQEPFPWLRHYIEEGTAFACEFVRKWTVQNALRSSAFYVEFVDVLYLYRKLINGKPLLDIDTLEQTIYQETGGHSLDYCALKAVRRR